MKLLYKLLIENKQKAIVGFLATAATAILSQNGFTLDMTLGEALEVIGYGLLGWIGVYVKANK